MCVTSCLGMSDVWRTHAITEYWLVLQMWSVAQEPGGLLLDVIRSTLLLSHLVLLDV